MAYVVRMEPLSDTDEPPRERPEALPTRVGLVVLAAVLTQIVVIAAIGNQWVTPKLVQAYINERSTLVSDFKASLITYNWRFNPQAGDVGHVWLSQVLLIGVTLALTALFVAVIVRGPSSYGRIFLTCWISVWVATIFGGYARGLTLKTSQARLQQGLFSDDFGPNTIVVFSGLLLGLLVGLVAAAVTVSQQKRSALGPKVIEASPSAAPATVEPEQPPPFFPDPPRTRPSPTGQPAARFPVPPDDEDLGHRDE
jgi:hypothetical protein